MGVGSVNDRTAAGVVTTPGPETTVQPTTVRTQETVTPSTVAPAVSDAFTRDGTPVGPEGTRGTAQEGLAGTSGGAQLAGTDPVAAGERLYAASRQEAQQIAANAAARATAETLAVRGEFQYAQEVVQTVQGNPSNEVARRTLTALDGNLKQCDALISDMETRLGAANTLLAQPAVEGDAENGRARAEAQALLGSYRTGSDGQMVDTGSLEDRLAAARDARTTLLLAQASLRSAAEPLTPESKILGRLEGRGGEIERLQALVTSTPADDPRRAEYQHVLEALQSTATQVHGRWQAAHATLADVEKSLGMRAGRDQGATNLVQRLTAVEAQLGISGPRSAADVAAVQARLGTVIQAQHQQAALITSFLRSDAGMTDADLIAAGILKRTPEDAVRRVKADNPGLARQFGLENADPTRLTPQEQQVGTMLALDTDPRALGRGLDRLYAEWRIDPASRNRSQDLTALANLARLGQVGAADGQSLPALRQNFMVGRQVASATEIRALATFVSGRNDSRSLAAIAGDPRVPRDIRLTADKLDHNATTRGMLSRTARDAGATAPGVDSRALGALAERVAAYEYPGEGGARYNGKLFFENFYDPARLDQDVDKLFHAMKGIGTDERTIFGVLGARQPNERQAIVTEYARRMRAEGYKGDDACPTALYNWLRGDLSGWEYGRAVSLMEQRKTGADWANDLRTHPDAIIDNPQDPRRGAMRTPEGRLDYQRQYFNIFRNPYNAQDMGDREGVTRWQQADATAATSLRAYEAAVASGDRNRIRTAEAAFTSSAGEAIAQYKLLSETYSTQLDERVRSLQQWEEGIIVGGVVVAATAATIATAGAASAAGFGAVAAVSAGFAAGTAAGTAVGFGLRVEQEALHTGGLGNMNWNRIGERTFGDFKMAAGSAIAAAIPTVGLARLQQAAWFVGRTATVGTAMAETANAATTIERVALTARLANIGKNAAATGVLNTAGSFSMRGVHWAANTIAGVQQDQSPDLAFSWQNLFIEMGSGAAMGAANPFLANLTNAERATTMLGRATARGSGFAFDMSINLADATARNVAYGRDPTEGLTQSLLVGAPANIAGGIAGRRAALMAGERSQRARTVLGDPAEVRGFVEFAQRDPALRTKFLTPDGQLSPTARLGDFELAVGSWDRSRATAGRTSTPVVETPVARPTADVTENPVARPAADVTENPVARPATEVTDGPIRTPREIADGVRDTDFGRRVQAGDNAGAQLELMTLSAELSRQKGVTWKEQKAALKAVGIDLDNAHSLRSIGDREQLLAAFGTLRELRDPPARASTTIAKPQENAAAGHVEVIADFSTVAPGLRLGRTVRLPDEGGKSSLWCVAGRAEDGTVILRNVKGERRTMADAALLKADRTLSKTDYVPPTPDEIAVFEAFRQEYAAPWTKTVKMLEELFPDASVPARLKAPERIHEAFFRKGWSFDTIDDVAGTCVVAKDLQSSVEVLRTLFKELPARGIKIIEPKGTFNEADISALLARDKKWFRTTGFVIEVDGKQIELGVQTHVQRAWTEAVHDTPVYKPNIFQAEWHMTDTQAKALRDYAYAVSKYTHFRELSQMAANGTYSGPLKPVARPAPLDAARFGMADNAKVTNLVNQLQGMVGP